ncbi:BadF/BadG/BcrA/BcrD ATPase family protein [Clostridium oceanicum]|uniref:BadF/BadG/BcrA/BcrD ATPase family protein n=1 Tax=Clostridium oceanicum TaxID=1543 RepID=A0ABN1J9Y5_9CLOT
MEYIIGVDAGGTKTEAVAYDFKGKELETAYSGFGNMVIDRDVAIKNILKAIDMCIKNLKEHTLKAIYLGVAAVEVGENKDIIFNAVYDKFKTKVKVYNDGELALYSLLKGKEGILTIAGTGSICFGILDSKKVVTGGWGHILGDEGSGYYIAIKALKKIIEEEESNLPKSEFRNRILNKFNITDINEFKDLVYNSSKDKVASIMPLICEMAEENEQYSNKILKEAGKDLGRTTEFAWKKLGSPSSISIGIKGSVITKASIVKNAFKDYINSKIENVNIIEDEVSSCKGAYYLSSK